MSIKVVCPGGHRLQLADSYAGKRVKCPKCGLTTPVPEPEPIELFPILPATEPSFESSNSNQPEWFASNGQSPDMAPSVAQPSVRQKPTLGVARPNARPSTLLLTSIGVGSFLMVFLAGLMTWMIAGPRYKVTSEVAIGSVKNAGIEPRSVDASNVATKADANANANANALTNPASDALALQPLQPSNETEPSSDATGLRKVRFDERVECFQFPSTIWASAYDETTGRLAVTNDAQGILIFELDKMLNGSTEPIRAIPTQGQPRAVCLKYLGDKRVFVFAEASSARLHLVDVDTLELVDELPIQNVSMINYLHASFNPADPYLYFASTDISNGSNIRADLIGRLNLVSGIQDPSAGRVNIDFHVSSDGEYIYSRDCYGSWNDFVSNPNLDTSQQNPRLAYVSQARSPMYQLGEKLAIGSRVFQMANVANRTVQFPITPTDFEPQSMFKSVPVVFGLGTNEMVFGSPNDFRQFESIPFPQSWLRNWKQESEDPKFKDSRYRTGICNRTRSAYYDVFADDTRKIAIAVFDEHLVVAPLDRLKLPVEKLIVPSQTLPKSIQVGALTELNLNAHDASISIEFVPSPDWLDSESLNLVGNRPSNRALHLRDSVDESATLITLRDVSGIKNVKTPFRLRVGNEIMTVLEIGGSGGPHGDSLEVTRTRKMMHQNSTRVSLVNEQGVENFVEASTPAGEIMYLNASVNSNQTGIILSDRNFDSLKKRVFPYPVQLGSERMLVLAADDFRKVLKVQRTLELEHNVSEPFVILDENANKDLPSVANGVLKWTPSVTSVGKQNVRLRATRDGVSTEWIWPVEVLSPFSKVDLPFYVEGINPDFDSKFAVVWGRPHRLDRNDTNEGKSSNSVSILGVYDLEKQSLIKQTKVPFNIASAALHKTGIYASSSERLDGKLNDKIRRYDVKSLEVLGELIHGNVERITLIGDQHLLAGSLVKIPEMKISMGPNKCSVHGRLKDGWLLNGVVWDQAQKKQKLLLFPFKLQTTPDKLPTKEGWVTVQANGPYVGLWWSARGLQEPKAFQMRDRSTTLLTTELALYVKNSNSLGVIEPKANQTIVPYESNANEKQNEPTYIERFSSNGIAEGSQHIFIAVKGSIHAILKGHLPKPTTPFHFEEQQDKFVLEAGKPSRLRYFAPGAARYSLKMWFGLKYDPAEFLTFDDISKMTVVKLESLDGNFELNLNAEEVAIRALKQAEIEVREGTSQDRQRKIIDYIKEHSDDIKEMTGNAPRSIPIVATVLVEAEHENGFDRAGMIHSYLVEPPIKELQRLIK